MNRARNTVVVLLTFVGLILIFLAFVWLMNREGVNAGLPLVNASIRENDEPAAPAWLLIPQCPVGRRNIPTLPQKEYDA